MRISPNKRELALAVYIKAGVIYFLTLIVNCTSVFFNMHRHVKCFAFVHSTVISCSTAVPAAIFLFYKKQYTQNKPLVYRHHLYKRLYAAY
jgi:hypothetical protein